MRIDVRKGLTAGLPSDVLRISNAETKTMLTVDIKMIEMPAIDD